MKQYIKTSQSVEQDSMGNPLTPEQSAFFKDSKIRDSQGRLLVCYHGTKNAGFEEFLPQDFVKSLHYKFGKNNVNCFTTDKYNAMGYSGYSIKHLPNGETAEPEPYDFVSNEHGKKSGIYAVYLNIKNLLVIDPDDNLYNPESLYDNRNWKNIKRDGAPKRARIQKFFDKYYNYSDDETTIEDIIFYGLDLEQDLKRIQVAMIPDGDEFEFRTISTNNDLWSNSNGSEIITTNMLSDLLDALEENFEDYQTDDYYTKESTNDIILETLFDRPEYDGIVFKNILDSADLLGMVTQTTIVTLKSSNQIKSINNKKPTSSGNINASNIV